MDQQTVETYSTNADLFAAEWRNQRLPTDMYALLQRYFMRGGKTADIGCGAGRDVAWLNEHGFPAVGYDAAEGLLAQAAADYPSLNFRRDALPDLNSIASDSYDNVLCETVLMHLLPDEITRACARLMDILRPNGTLYLSWRVEESASRRDASGHECRRNVLVRGRAHRFVLGLSVSSARLPGITAWWLCRSLQQRSEETGDVTCGATSPVDPIFDCHR